MTWRKVIGRWMGLAVAVWMVSRAIADDPVAMPAHLGEDGRPTQAEAGRGWREAADQYRAAGSESGFMQPEELMAFLDDALASGPETEEPAVFRGGWLAVLLILLGGLALNLTPCVLPMIPVNLAILGAGARGGSRRRGLLLGSLYGLGIALAYGVLGLVVVLTGATFGALNAMPWFNLTIAAVFVVLALAMFDVIHIDLARFQPVAGERSGAGPAVAFGMGVAAALLAGACVAPVVISVLVWSSDLYLRGLRAGLLLPFVLGLGMALPWPLAGAGLSFLPKPGRWMIWVRNAFGVLILLLALYYGRLGIQLLRDMPPSPVAAEEDARRPDETPTDDPLAVLEDGLRRGLAERKPVFLDFWATWCRVCLRMDRTTFRDEAVRSRLEEDFIFIKFVAERPSEEGIRDVMEYYGVLGLPTYLVLVPDS